MILYACGVILLLVYLVMLLVTTRNNTNPVNITLNAHHGLKVGDSLKVDGITNLTEMNGEWIISAVTERTATIEDRVGNNKFFRGLLISVLISVVVYAVLFLLFF